MPRIICLTERYQGFHDGEPLRLAEGEAADVSAETAEELTSTFPGWFKVARAQKARAKTTAAQPRTTDATAQVD